MGALDTTIVDLDNRPSAPVNVRREPAEKRPPAREEKRPPDIEEKLRKNPTLRHPLDQLTNAEIELFHQVQEGDTIAAIQNLKENPVCGWPHFLGNDPLGMMTYRL